MPSAIDANIYLYDDFRVVIPDTDLPTWCYLRSSEGDLVTIFIQDRKAIDILQEGLQRLADLMDNEGLRLQPLPEEVEDDEIPF